MEANFNTSLEILQLAQQEVLYDKLLHQIAKDFVLANVEVRISEDLAPIQLRDIVREKIYFLLLEKFPEYLNLLYVVDIPEREIKKLNTLDAADASVEVCFLILKREWQKVWFKHKYNS